MNKSKSFLLGVALSSLVASRVSAADAACDSLGGSVLFRDSLYGLGIGAILGGLGVAASDSSDNSTQVVAGTALAGTLFGLGFGIYEVASRDCAEPKPDQYNKNEYNFKSSSHLRSGLQLPSISYVPTRMESRSAWSMQFKYLF